MNLLLIWLAMSAGTCLYQYFGPNEWGRALDAIWWSGDALIATRIIMKVLGYEFIRRG